MHAYRCHGVAPVQFGVARTERADQFFLAGVDVGAIEGENAGFAAGDQVRDGGLLVHGPVPARQLPAAADDA